MTTQGSTFPDTNIPAIRKPMTDGRSASETIEAAGHELKAKAGEAIEKGKHRASELYESGKARASEWKGGFQEGIREKPIQSVLIAAAVGAVIGVIVGRRS
jgi:ElaB/YqjD/DUF883 family membrane-anchored ribosome-binding protein